MRHKDTNMPESVQEIYGWLEDELIWTREKWHTFTGLFRNLKGNESVAIQVNRFASEFFLLCQEVLGHDVILALCRMNDPAKSGGNMNMTLEQLVNVVDKDCEDIGPRLKEARKLVTLAMTPLREHRNKSLGHNDFKRCSSDEAAPGVKYAAVDKSLESVEHMMNVVRLQYDGCDTSFDLLGPRAVDGLVASLDEWATFTKGRMREQKGANS